MSKPCLADSLVAAGREKIELKIREERGSCVTQVVCIRGNQNRGEGRDRTLNALYLSACARMIRCGEIERQCLNAEKPRIHAKRH